MEKFVIRNAANDARFKKEHTAPGVLYWSGKDWVTSVKEAALFSVSEADAVRIPDAQSQQVVWNCHDCGSECEVCSFDHNFTNPKNTMGWFREKMGELTTELPICQNCGIKRQIKELEETGLGFFYFAKRENRKVITTWPGEVLTDQVFFVTSGYDFGRNKWELYHIRFNGKLYSAKHYVNSGDYAKLRRIKG